MLFRSKTFGHLGQSVFLQEIHSITDGPPPDINLTNEKNNGEAVLKIIEKNLINSAHDVSSGGLILTLAEMAIHSKIGIKISKPKKLSNIFEYFFGEDQGRYVIEINQDKLTLVEKILKENNVFYEQIGVTQKNNFELTGEFKLDLLDLYNINNQWYYKY